MHGRSRAKQFQDLLKLYLLTEEESGEYYGALMARHQGSSALLNYLPYLPFIWIVMRVQRDLLGAPPFFLCDKGSFGQWARRNGISSPPEILVRSGAEDELESKFSDLGQHIILKPRCMNAGMLVEVWKQKKDGVWVGQNDELNQNDLIGRIRDLAARDSVGFVVQKRLQNHPDLSDLCGKALSTCRVVAIINEKGRPEVVELFWRMSTIEDAIVDNFHAGGVFWSGTDFEYGKVNLGVGPDTGRTQLRLERHPKTGQPVAGTYYPFWQEIKNLALPGHAKMPNVVLVGWNIAMTVDGPVAVEVNFPPGSAPRTQITSDGLGQARYGEILGFHAKQWLAARNHEPSII